MTSGLLVILRACKIALVDFGSWLDASMHRRGLSQAALARTVGVADAQVSRWRRGQVVPSVQSLQRIADVFGVPRITLDRIAGYPVSDEVPSEDPDLLLYAGQLKEVLQLHVPPRLWPAYVASCTALADALASSLDNLLHPPDSDEPAHNIGFRPG